MDNSTSPGKNNIIDAALVNHTLRNFFSYLPTDPNSIAIEGTPKDLINSVAARLNNTLQGLLGIENVNWVNIQNHPVSLEDLSQVPLSKPNRFTIISGNYLSSSLIHSLITGVPSSLSRSDLIVGGHASPIRTIIVYVDPEKILEELSAEQDVEEQDNTLYRVAAAQIWKQLSVEDPTNYILVEDKADTDSLYHEVFGHVLKFLPSEASLKDNA